MATKRRVHAVCSLILYILFIAGIQGGPNDNKNDDVLPKLANKLNKQNPEVEDGDVNRKPFDSHVNPPNRQVKRMQLADLKECPEIRKICPGKMSRNNFAVLDCLANEVKVSSDLSKRCHNVIWEYKKNLTKDIRFDSAANDACKDSLAQLSECNQLKQGEGHIIPCLVENLPNISDPDCHTFLEKMAPLVFTDYRLMHKFVEGCEKDIKQLRCGRNFAATAEEEQTHSQVNTIQCLEKKMKKVSPACKLQILRVAELQSDDFHMDRPLFYACREDRETFCKGKKSGNGKIYKCLMKHKFDKGMSTECVSKLTLRQKLIQEDYKVAHTLTDMCRNDIQAHGCLKGKLPSDTKTKLSHILICLEGAMKDGSDVTHECQGEMTEMRRQLLEDYMISPEIMIHCDKEIKTTCKGLEREGKTLHCLMDQARPTRKKHFKASISTECSNVLEDLIQETNPGENIMVDPVLQEACQAVIQTACKGVNPGGAQVIGCLMEHVNDKNVMAAECEEKLMEIQYFVVRDFRLDPQLYKECKKDAQEVCHAPQNWNEHKDKDTAESTPLIFPCLYSQLKVNKLSARCSTEVKRVMHQRAASVELNPRIEDKCLPDLGKFCSDNIENGHEFECLEDNYDELQPNCKLAIGNFTEDVDDDPDIDVILMKACEPMLQHFCKDIVEKTHDEEGGEIMQCLITHKRHQEMDPKCAAGIEHHQLTTLKNYEFSRKFKEACKKDVFRYCKKTSKDKAAIISCLSEHVRNDTLLEENKPRIGKKCRSQLRVELFQRAESIDLDPNLKEACKDDIKKKCYEMKHGNAQVIECLKHAALKHGKEGLSKKCRKFVFKRERMEAIDARIDFALSKACKVMIKHYCGGEDPSRIVACLRNHKHDDDFDPKCRRFIKDRQIMKSKDIRLNPSLVKGCKLDIPKFCTNKVSVRDLPPEIKEGTIIECLKRKLIKHRLSSPCERVIKTYMKSQALDYRQDPVLNQACNAEINSLCYKEVKNVLDGIGEGGEVEECLKDHRIEIKSTACKQQVAYMIAEGRVDVHVDPLLNRACSVDLSHYCSNVESGEGRLMSCLITALDDRTVRLSKKCRKMLSERRDMWGYAVKVLPADTFEGLYGEIMGSTSRNYFLGIILAVIGLIFIFGLCFGRVTKRVSASHKNK